MARPRVRSHLLLAGLISPIVGAMLCAGQVPSTGEPPSAALTRAWAPEVRAAIAAYQAGNYEATQALCLRVLSNPSVASAHRDAQVVQALCLLRMPARADRVEGRARLAQLAQEDPALQDEPECNLAYGIGLAGLAETAEALDVLERAAGGFAAQQRPNRQLAALVALAEAWGRHAEWEVTPRRFDVRQPMNRAEADAIRTAQIQAVHIRAEALPKHEEALAQIDLVLAKHLIQSGSGLEAGRQILARLADAPTLAPAGLEAALWLAQQAEESGQWATALRLYERVRKEVRGEPAQQAEKRVAEITSPQIRMECPASVQSGHAAALHVRARGLDAVQLEVRSVDVEAWLASAPRRGNEMALPESGSVQMTRELSCRAAEAYAWWDSGELDFPVEFVAPPGGYVVIARGKARDGHQQTVKRLMIVSDLSAVCFVGPQSVAVWATLASESKEEPRASDALRPSAKFWMQRSFTPVEPRFEGGVARFSLPAEARVMKDRDWFFLVRLGEPLALCRGRLSAAEPADDLPAALLFGGPPNPRVGESLYVSGLLLGGPVTPTQPGTAAGIQLQVVDAREQLVETRDVKLSASGAFAAEFPIGPQLAGQHVRVVPRYQGRVLSNVAGRLAAGIPAAEGPNLRVWCEAPTWVTPSQGVLSGYVLVTYPWGTPLTRGEAACQFQAQRLPVSGSNDRPAALALLDRGGQTDDDGRFSFALSTGEFGVSDAPLAVTAKAHVTSSWSGSGTASRAVLVAPQQPHAWLACQPSEPEIGQEVRFQLGWFGPGGAIVEKLPSVDVRRGDEAVARLRLTPTGDALAAASWRPPAPGSYDITASLTVLHEPPIRLQRTIQVQPERPATRPTAAVRCEAHFVREGDRCGVRVRLEGHAPPSAAVLVAGGEPLAIRASEPLDGPTEFFWPLEHELPVDVHVVVVDLEDGGARALAVADVAPDARRSPSVQLDATTRDVWPGATTTVIARVQAADEARGLSLVARLIDASGSVPPNLELASRVEPSSRFARLAVVVSGGERVDLGAVEGGETTVPPLRERVLSLSGGTVYWTASLGVESASVSLPVRLPAAPGVYRLVVAVRAPDGQVETDDVLLDARRGIEPTVDVPARLAAGDRAPIAVLLESGSETAVKASVRLTSGEGLHIEALRGGGDDKRVLRPAGDEPVDLELSPGGRAWLYADVEAARVGVHEAAVSVEVDGVRRSAKCSYEVVPFVEQRAADAQIKVKRTLTVWTRLREEPGESEEHGADSHARRWRSSPWAPDVRLLPGQFLEVREEVTVLQPQGEYAWSQRLPATCRPGPSGRDQPRIGSPGGGRSDELLFRGPKLERGSQVHEYWLAVVRPGACVLPSPEVRVDGTSIPLAVEPEDVRPIVVDRE